MFFKPTHTAQRDEAFDLAPHDLVNAAKVADIITHPWFQAQAYAAVARFAPGDALVVEYAAKAVRAAKRGDDAYQIAGSASWALRALVDRGLTEQALGLLRELLAIASTEVLAASRAEAYMHLFLAAFPLQGAARSVVVEALLQLEQTAPGWRSSRALRICCEALVREDPATAIRIAEQIKTPSYRRQAETAIAEGRGIALRELFC